MTVDLRPNTLVTNVQRELLPRARPKTDGTAPIGLVDATDLPELIVFAGFLGDPVEHPSGNGGAWRVLYLDWALTSWLLVEETGIVGHAEIRDASTSIQRDAIWVSADASVGQGNGSLSVESQFLTGAFTRAADFDSAPTGGTFGATTGVFCEARTPSCCHRKSS